MGYFSSVIPSISHLNPRGLKKSGRDAGVLPAHETHPRLGLSVWQKHRDDSVWGILQLPEDAGAQGHPPPSPWVSVLASGVPHG